MTVDYIRGVVGVDVDEVARSVANVRIWVKEGVVYRGRGL